MEQKIESLLSQELQINIALEKLEADVSSKFKEITEYKSIADELTREINDAYRSLERNKQCLQNELFRKESLYTQLKYLLDEIDDAYQNRRYSEISSLKFNKKMLKDDISRIKDSINELKHLIKNNEIGILKRNRDDAYDNIDTLRAEISEAKKIIAAYKTKKQSILMIINAQKN